MKLKNKLLPIIALSGIATASVPLVACSNGDVPPEPDPLVHNLVAKNIVDETKDLFNIECSKESFTDKEIDEGLELSFTLTPIGAEQLDDYIFIHYGYIDIKTIDDESITLDSGYSWEKDNTQDFVWHLIFLEGKDVTSKLKSAKEMTISFKVQNYQDVSVEAIDQSEQPVSDDFNISPSVIDFDTFDNPLSISAGDTAFSVTSILVSTSDGSWMALSKGDGKDYTTYEYDPYTCDITFSEIGMEKLGFAWYKEPVEILRLRVTTY